MFLQYTFPNDQKHSTASNFVGFKHLLHLKVRNLTKVLLRVFAKDVARVCITQDTHRPRYISGRYDVSGLRAQASESFD